MVAHCTHCLEKVVVHRVGSLVIEPGDRDGGNMMECLNAVFLERRSFFTFCQNAYEFSKVAGGF